MSKDRGFALINHLHVDAEREALTHQDLLFKPILVAIFNPPTFMSAEECLLLPAQIRLSESHNQWSCNTRLH